MELSQFGSHSTCIQKQFSGKKILNIKSMGKFGTMVLVDISEFVWKRVQINDRWTPSKVFCPVSDLFWLLPAHS